MPSFYFWTKSTVTSTRPDAGRQDYSGAAVLVLKNKDSMSRSVSLVQMLSLQRMFGLYYCTITRDINCNHRSFGLAIVELIAQPQVALVLPHRLKDMRRTVWVS